MQGDVSGLQVLKDGKWFAVEQIPNAFVVNVADQIEVYSKINVIRFIQTSSVQNLFCFGWSEFWIVSVSF